MTKDNQTADIDPRAEELPPPPESIWPFQVVEDESLIRIMTAEMIIDLGHVVREAVSAEDALNLLEATRSDIVSQDLGLPSRSGEDFCQKVRRLWPEIAILFATDLGNGPILSDPSRTALLQQLFSAGDLATAVARGDAASNLNQKSCFKA